MLARNLKASNAEGIMLYSNFTHFGGRPGFPRMVTADFSSCGDTPPTDTCPGGVVTLPTRPSRTTEPLGNNVVSMPKYGLSAGRGGLCPGGSGQGFDSESLNESNPLSSGRGVRLLGDGSPLRQIISGTSSAALTIPAASTTSSALLASLIIPLRTRSSNGKAIGRNSSGSAASNAAASARFAAAAALSASAAFGSFITLRCRWPRKMGAIRVNSA